MSFFRKNGKAGVRKLDAVVTGLIVGSAIAAVYGLKRRRARVSEEPAGPGLLSRLFSRIFKKR